MTRIKVDTGRVIQALEDVPEKRLKLIDLAWELLDEEGKIDYKKVVDRLPDINLAVAEADAYAGATETAINALRKLTWP